MLYFHNVRVIAAERDIYLNGMMLCKDIYNILQRREQPKG